MLARHGGILPIPEFQKLPCVYSKIVRTGVLIHCNKPCIVPYHMWCKSEYCWQMDPFTFTRRCNVRFSRFAQNVEVHDIPPWDVWKANMSLQMHCMWRMKNELHTELLIAFGHFVIPCFAPEQSGFTDKYNALLKPTRNWLFYRRAIISTWLMTVQMMSGWRLIIY